MSMVMRKRQERQQRTDQLLNELGFEQEFRCQKPRATNGINVIPVGTIQEVPRKALIVQADSDMDATSYFLRFEPTPATIFRLGHLYFADAPELPAMFQELPKN
jgi:hypothetical protein